ncbi:RagB/SusD family nutrient uptake outer membrane protein [Ferruginibacter sp.]|uniref:RagB/SusD family nutrient uptake outer membrane protein n=2 Tax=Ferruginibacter sp. TaxID=1940288 RepID=UPI00374DFB6A
MPAEENGWDDYFPEIKFFNEYPAGLRKDITFHTVINGNIPWQNDATKHPYYAKFRVNNGEATWQTAHPLSMIRYAHVLLIYAEAKARSGGPDAVAYSSVNSIRQRAGLADLINLSAADFATAIVKERSWEFAGEWTRWFDFTRLEMVESANQGKDPRVLPVIGPIKYYVPIPASDKALNPNL